MFSRKSVWEMLLDGVIVASAYGIGKYNGKTQALSEIEAQKEESEIQRLRRENADLRKLHSIIETKAIK